ncbi:hypothetical protein J6590_038547 [Homalodisca vitripennis]|nr:hypothetical protein J6590_038547 [Homalodisca vitripennis]
MAVVIGMHSATVTHTTARPHAATQYYTGHDDQHGGSDWHALCYRHSYYCSPSRSHTVLHWTWVSEHHETTSVTNMAVVIGMHSATVTHTTDRLHAATQYYTGHGDQHGGSDWHALCYRHSYYCSPSRCHTALHWTWVSEHHETTSVTNTAVVIGMHSATVTHTTARPHAATHDQHGGSDWHALCYRHSYYCSPSRCHTVLHWTWVSEHHETTSVTNMAVVIGMHSATLTHTTARLHAATLDHTGQLLALTNDQDVIK